MRPGSGPLSQSLGQGPERPSLVYAPALPCIGVRGSSPRASTKLGTIKNLHSTDSIDTEDSGTRGRSIWVHSRLLDSSVSAGEGGAVGKGRGVQPRRRTPLGRPGLS